MEEVEKIVSMRKKQSIKAKNSLLSGHFKLKVRIRSEFSIFMIKMETHRNSWNFRVAKGYSN
jgi:hypothetical protein